MTARSLGRGSAVGWPTPAAHASLRRAIGHGLVLSGLLFAGYLFAFAAPAAGTFGYDAFAYWSVDGADPYRVGHGQFGSFVYAPILAQVFSLAGALTWPTFLWLWTAMLLGTVVWLGGRLTLAVLAFPPVALELYYGNVHLLLATAVVLGFRHPWAWAFVLLSKVTPGIGLLWFAARRDWRSLAVAGGVTIVVVSVSVLMNPNLWFDWIRTLQAGAGAGAPTPPGGLPIPLLARLPVAALVAWWGGRTDRQWTVPVAALLAMPVVWLTSLAILAALPAVMSRRDQAGRVV